MSDKSTHSNTVELGQIFERADNVVAKSVIGRPRRGSGYVPKIDAKIRLNVEVMDWLKSMGPRHYSRINGLLTALMEADRADQQQTEIPQSEVRQPEIRQAELSETN